MKKNYLIDLTYYPGCSLKTTSQENNASLIYLFEHLGYNLIELEDWNCCGSSSAHSIDTELAFDLASRNLSLAPVDKSCIFLNSWIKLICWDTPEIGFVGWKA